MQHTLAVRSSEPAREPQRELEHLRGGHRLRQLIERAPAQQLRDEIPAAVDLADAVQGHDVGVLQPRERAGLEEQLLPRAVAPDVQELHGDVATEQLVVCGEDLARAAGAERPAEPVFVELGGRRRRA